jgi:uncharacterized protein (DUF433 family)
MGGWQMTLSQARDMLFCMSASVVSVNKNIQGGTPCFVGTRVPVASLFDHLEAGYTIDYFLSQFPSVTREQVIALLEEAKARTEDARLAPT